MMVPPEANMQIEGLKQEVTRLKCDKLDLLRQNVVSTHQKRESVVATTDFNDLCGRDCEKN